MLDDGSCEYSGCTDPNAQNYDPDATISSTTFPTEVYLAGEFDTSTSTVNNLKYNGAKFSVSSAGTDANGNKFLNLKSDSTAAINITDTKIKVLHTASKDVSAYFEGGTGIFDNQTEHFASKRTRSGSNT